MPLDLILHLVVLISFSLDISLIMHLIFSSDPPQTSVLKSFLDQVIWVKSCNFVRQ